MNKKDLLVIAEKNCPACNFFKSKVNSVKVCDLDSKECFDLAEKMDIKKVPTILLKDGGKFEKCDIEYKEGRFTAVCKNQRIELK